MHLLLFLFPFLLKTHLYRLWSMKGACPIPVNILEFIIIGLAVLYGFVGKTIRKSCCRTPSRWNKLFIDLRILPILFFTSQDVKPNILNLSLCLPFYSHTADF